ncbi:pentapeptide repeat-containing protein [Egbenema bharatensis]|uniref:pentapeptide repeat-containing protein n=1 Tax=Egbenema bharatensis TaxID=3463334 RepID=UPI003A844021
MKAKELLRQYAQGERNFRGANLRGLSLQGKNLSGADFTRSDIRGTDFTNANLQDANFARATAGLQPIHVLVLGIALILLAAILGSVSGFVDRFAELEFHSSQFVDLIPKWLTLAVLASFAFVWLQNGIAASFTVFILAFIVSGVLALVSSAAVMAAGAIMIAITLASFVAVATIILVTLMMIAILAIRPLAAIAVGVSFCIPFIGLAFPSAGESAIGLAALVVLLSISIAWRTLRGDRRQAQIMMLASFLASRWATCFQGANLTNVDFTHTELRNVNFDDAILTHVRWNDPLSPSSAPSAILLKQ